MSTTRARRRNPGPSSPWTRPPERPARYWLGSRLSDMAHGWLDGRHGIPRLPGEPGPERASEADGGGSRPAPPLTAGAAATGPSEIGWQAPRHRAGSGGASEARDASEPGGTGEPEDAAGPGDTAGPPPVIQTPRMRVLRRQASESIEGEELLMREEVAVLRLELAGHLARRDALQRELDVCEGLLTAICVPLEPAELEVRRLAEQDPRSRPDVLIHARRRTERERAVEAAQRRRLSVAAQFAEAQREAHVRAQLIWDRAAVARAAARRHHELAHRRIATYQQQLVHTHDQGLELNKLLLEHPVDPQLPGWVSQPRPDEDYG